MRVAVTGATGLVGGFVVARLLQVGHQVRALKRATSKIESVSRHEDVEWVAGDLANRNSLIRLLDGCEGLVHAAFEHTPGKYRGGEGEDSVRFYKTNATQSFNLLELADQSKVKRTVFMSSRAVYDGLDLDGAPIPDHAPVSPTTLYGEVKVEVEKVGSSLPSIGFCSLRATGIYGIASPLHENKWFDLFQRALTGESDPRSLDKALRTEVHGEDVAEAVLLLLESSASQLKLNRFNCSDVAISQEQLFTLFQGIMNGKDPSEVELPEALPAKNWMSCDGLLKLGWQPGGMAKLHRTLGDSVKQDTVR